MVLMLIILQSIQLAILALHDWLPLGASDRHPLPYRRTTRVAD